MSKTAGKVRTVHRCTECGAEYPKWSGRCESCNAWNTLVEEIVTPALHGRHRATPGSTEAWTGTIPVPVELASVERSSRLRWHTSIDEFDFVLGGGIVPGSMVLIGGEPGIGKSTLLLQVSACLESSGRSVLYVSGEESALQIRLRADRLASRAEGVLILAETSLEAIVASASAWVEECRSRGREECSLVVDSIQTLHSEMLASAPGSVAQVRECAGRLMRFAKETGTAVFIVGHVTKDGGIAGPRTLEHIVDTVLYFEGDGTLEHRLLRATKNRFGSVDEIGVFRMSDSGLAPVSDPSSLFVGDRREGVSGSAVCPLIEGTRPVLVEVQALAARAGYATPQRVASGIDSRRLALLLAVLEKRGGIPCSTLDVFCNIAGGIRVREPAVDLAVAAAVASSVMDRPLPPHSVFLGEVGLNGEIRPVAQTERRLAEAAKRGMSAAFLSDRSLPVKVPPGFGTIGVRTLSDVLSTTIGAAR